MLSIDISGFCIIALNNIYLICVYVNSKDPFQPGVFICLSLRGLLIHQIIKCKLLSLGTLSNLVKSREGLNYFPSHNLLHLLSATST